MLLFELRPSAKYGTKGLQNARVLAANQQDATPLIRRGPFGSDYRSGEGRGPFPAN